MIIWCMGQKCIVETEIIGVINYLCSLKFLHNLPLIITENNIENGETAILRIVDGEEFGFKFEKK